MPTRWPTGWGAISRSQVIQASYENLLGRAAGGSDVSGWQTLFDNGATQLSMQQALVGSAEFKNNPPAPSSGSVTKWAY